MWIPPFICSYVCAWWYRLLASIWPSQYSSYSLQTVFLHWPSICPSLHYLAVGGGKWGAVGEGVMGEDYLRSTAYWHFLFQTDGLNAASEVINRNNI